MRIVVSTGVYILIARGRKRYFLTSDKFADAPLLPVHSLVTFRGPVIRLMYDQQVTLGRVSSQGGWIKATSSSILDNELLVIDKYLLKVHRV